MVKLNLNEALTDATVATEGLVPGQTPLRITNPEMRNWKTIQGVPVDKKAKIPSDRKNFFFVAPNRVRDVIHRQFKRYFENPKKYNLSEESTIEDVIKKFDQERPINKINFLKDNNIDTKMKIKDARNTFDLSKFNPFIVESAFADEVPEKMILKLSDQDTPKQIMTLEENGLSQQKIRMKLSDAIYRDTPMWEKLGKGFGMGVAGTTKGLGGAFKWLGAEKVGKMVTDYASEMEEFYKIPDPDFQYQVAGGFGSLSTFFIPGLGVSRAVQAASMFPRLAAWLGVGASSVLEAATEAGSVYERGIDKGFTPEQLEGAANKTFWLNLPTLVFTNKLGLFADSGNAIMKALKSAPLEGIQEFTQQIIGNFASHDPVMEGALESAAVGMITGGVAGGVFAKLEDLEPVRTELKAGKVIKDTLSPEKAEVANQVTEEILSEQQGTIEKGQVLEGTKGEILPAESLPAEIKVEGQTVPLSIESKEVPGLITPEQHFEGFYEQILKPEEVMDKTPMDLAERNDIINDHVSALDDKYSERIKTLKEELTLLKGKESKSTRDKVNKEIDDITANRESLQSTVQEENINFQNKIASMAIKYGKEAGLELGDVDADNPVMDENISDEWQNFRDELLIRLYERPYIESNYN